MKRIAVGLIMLFLAMQSQAQILKPVKWQFTSKETAANEYDLIFTAIIDNGWHVYSQFIAEGGPVPTTFTFKANKAYERVGKVMETSKPIKYHDIGFDMDLVYYAKEAVFVQHVKLKSGISKITGTLEFMVCDDEKCLPPDEKDFSFDVAFSKGGIEMPKQEEGMKQEPSRDPKEGYLGPPSENKGTNLHPSNSPGGSSPKAGGAATRVADNTATEAAENNGTGNTPTGILKPVKWSFSSKKIKDDLYEVRLVADIETGWHIFAMDIPTDKPGPLPTAIKFTDNAAIKAEGEMKVKGELKKEFEEAFDMEVAYYENKAEFVQQFRISDPSAIIKGTLSYMACNESCIPPQDVNFEIPAVPANTAGAGTDVVISGVGEADRSLLSIFLEALVWGFAAILTPCVFPMIPLTVSFFTKNAVGMAGQSKSRSKGIGNSLLFGASIIILYTGIGTLLSAIFGGQFLQDMATNAYFNMAFFIIFLIFAFSFLGAFELTLPASWINKADSKAEKGGLLGMFFVAFTLALVSFSCTGPFIGTLLVSASQGGVKGPIVGMFGFSLALSLPFMVFAAFPALMQSLPKSGGWLNSVKVTFGFIELALALKFLSNVDLAYHLEFLKREYFLAIWIIIFALLGFYLLGKLKFSHDSDVPHLTVPRLILAIMVFAFAAYMVPGLWRAPLTALSGVLPPQHYSEWKPDEVAPANGRNLASASESDFNETKKYSDILHCPNGLDCYFDYDQAMRKAKAENKPLMLDFTGHNCANCRRMEETVWKDPRVKKILSEEVVLASLYTDDRAYLEEHEEYYSDVLEKKIDQLGEKWQELEIREFKTNAQPLYVMLDHHGKPLVQPRGVSTADDYVKFLNEAKNEFQIRHGDGITSMR